MRATVVGGLVLAGSAVVGAQVPGSPVLQNAFGNPGITVAANFGAGSGQGFYGAAGAWGLRGGRFQLSGAAGAARSNDATRGAYGARVSATVWTSSGGALGAGAFAGIGGAPRTRSDTMVTNPAVVIVPAGITVGYRRHLGQTRGMSLYASPLYRWTRLTTDTTSTSNGAFRVAAGFDFSFSPSFGLTVGGEFGGGRSEGGTSRGSAAFGAGVSFVPGRNR